MRPARRRRRWEAHLDCPLELYPRTRRIPLNEISQIFQPTLSWFWLLLLWVSPAPCCRLGLRILLLVHSHQIISYPFVTKGRNNVTLGDIWGLLSLKHNFLTNIYLHLKLHFAAIFLEIIFFTFLLHVQHVKEKWKTIGKIQQFIRSMFWK